MPLLPVISIFEVANDLFCLCHLACMTNGDTTVQVGYYNNNHNERKISTNILLNSLVQFPYYQNQFLYTESLFWLQLDNHESPSCLDPFHLVQWKLQMTHFGHVIVNKLLMVSEDITMQMKFMITYNERKISANIFLYSSA